MTCQSPGILSMDVVDITVAGTACCLIMAVAVKSIDDLGIVVQRGWSPGFCKMQGVNASIRDGPNVRLWHSAEAEGLGRLTERVPNVRPNFGRTFGRSSNVVR